MVLLLDDPVVFGLFALLFLALFLLGVWVLRREFAHRDDCHVRVIRFDDMGRGLVSDPLHSSEYDNMFDERLEQRLNEYEKKGWRLVGVNAGRYYFRVPNK